MRISYPCDVYSLAFIENPFLEKLILTYLYVQNELRSMALFRGFLSFFSAFNGISRYQLWTLVIIAGGISLILGSGVYFLVFKYGDNIGRVLLDVYPFTAGKAFLETIIEWLSRIILGLIVFFVYKYLLLIFLSPVLSIISEKIEVQLTHIKGKRFSLFGEIFRAIRFNLRNLYKELFYTVMLILAGFIPAFTPFAPIVIFLVQAYYLGIGFMDFYMERHFSFKESIEEGKRNRLWLTGMGAAVGIAIIVPFIGFFIAPVLATVAATEFGVKKYS